MVGLNKRTPGALLAPPRADARLWFWTWSVVLRVLTVTELTGNIAGACFYWLDGVLIRWLKVDISLRLMVARRKA